jgi:hypothetical protein
VSRPGTAIRRAVRERAGKRCEYCHRPESNSPFTYQIEHILSLKHGGSSDLDNLAWACVDCNISKGPDIAAYDPETGNLVALYNPRTQPWDEHFRMQHGLIEGITPAGRATVRLLEFNNLDRIEARQI